MCLHPQPVDPVPEETARVARAAFPEGTLYMTLCDTLGSVFEDEQFAEVFPTRGQPAQSPWRLALITVMQFAEDLSDRQAVQALRSRIDWKYLLALPLTDAGFDASVLSEFRVRLVAGTAERLLLEVLLKRCCQLGLLQARGQQRSDSTHVLAVIRGLNRLEVVGETLRHALDVLATVAPEWLRDHIQPEWGERYTRALDDYRLPNSEAARQRRADRIGADGMSVLDSLYTAPAPTWLRHIPAIETLRQVWVQNYFARNGRLCWRTTQEGIPPAMGYVGSPYDPEARYARKRTTSWIGYRVHLTETCDEERPHLITHVETALGPVADGEATPLIHQALEKRNLLPGVHLVDTAYLDAELLVETRQRFAVDLLGPTRRDLKWQAQAGQGFDLAHFTLDWERHQATCPEGQTSLSWSPVMDKANCGIRVIKIKFSSKNCRPCPSCALCIRSKKKYLRRVLTVRPRAQHEALYRARRREKTAAFTAQYAQRAGIEGTLSRAVRTCGVRRSRYVGLAKTHLQHVLTAMALNFLRLGEWFAAVPRATARRSPFARFLAQQAA